MTADDREGDLDLDLVRGTESGRTWLAALEALGPAPAGDEVVLPEGQALVDALLDLAVPHREVPLALAARPEPGTRAWWLVERTARALLARLGSLDHDPAPPDLPDVHPVTRWATLLALAAVVPRTRGWWRARGVPDDVVRATLADVGRHVTHARRRTGHGGLVNASWLALHARGQIVQLGRLQLERCRLSAEDAASITAQGTPVAAGDHALGVHVPDYCGPFTPQACADSLRRGVEFFARWFPDEPVAVATCHSWLLDPQLGPHLRPGSNTAAFRDLFHHVERTVTDDQSVVEFVYGRREPDLAALPQRTSLERAVAGHLLAGGHWRGGLGWLAWPPAV